MRFFVLFAGVLFVTHMADGFGRQTRDATSTISGTSDSKLCTSEKLRQIMIDNISSDMIESKAAIEKAVQKKFSGIFDVICARGEFAYAINSKLFCQEAANGVTCYAFRQI